ncbi:MULTISPECIES: cupin domain-containing protein [Pantoea]|jgi:Mannose-6-phosphate isomerase|uniref:Cupin n=2 Tax=Pantoea TaxID=53335 RepID=A0A0U3UWX8_9GAMM|nr:MULTISPECIES: cupin domain-containing protein [Pantoea]ALV94345.1 cupin [Pantoea vagans]KHJ69378.1 cupin [Pantoea rodasii]
MISKENAPHYIWGGNCDGWTLLERQDMLVIHERMPASSAEQRHYHSVSRQFFFVLSGELTMELQGEYHRLQAQQGIEIPPDAPHQARNDSASPVEFLVISHPTTRGDRTNF